MVVPKSLSLGIPVLLVCWFMLWTQDTFWNPLFFAGMWSGATLVMYSFSRYGYPGFRKHTSLMALSIPLWWWFEVINYRVGNWEYVWIQNRYSDWEYVVLSSIAFSTVIPALHAAWCLTTDGHQYFYLPKPVNRLWYFVEVVAGFLCQVLVLLFPLFAYPLVWVAPFLVADGFIGIQGGRNIGACLVCRKFAFPARLAMGGILCGALWEFWNFWSMPKWIYHVPYLDFLYVFEMPILGYGGYVPFVWFVYQLVRLPQLIRLSGEEHA